LRVWAQQTFSNQANSHEYPNRLCRRREAETALSAESWKWSRKMKQALYAATTALAITASAPAFPQTTDQHENLGLAIPSNPHTETAAMALKSA
jgi:hypothetical protein